MYIPAGDRGLTGGFIRQPGQIVSPTPEVMGEAPKMFRIRESPDSVKAFRVSKDAVIAAAVFESDEVHIYRLFDVKGDFLGDKKPLAPV